MIKELGGKGGIGSHHSAAMQSDTWLTPLQIISRLGDFDLDPCAAPSPRPWPTAKHHIEKPMDGLAERWEGRIWLNPPYGSAIGAWLGKMALHGSGIALTFARTETQAWHKWIWPYAWGVLFLERRLNFRLPDGTDPRKNSGGPSALIAYSLEDRDILWRSGIRGFLVEMAKRTHGV